MKYAITLFVLFFCFLVNGQITVVNQRATPTTINALSRDKIDLSLTNLGTNIGFIQLNSGTGQITGAQNLVSQNPPIGNVRGLTQDPITEILFYALDNGIAISNGDITTLKTYNNSNLVVGKDVESFESLQVSAGFSGAGWVFHQDETIIQKYNNGDFEDPIDLGFSPKSMLVTEAELIFGTNEGLFKMEKSSGEITEYNTNNSDLLSNAIESLYIDALDILYIGTFLGLNTLSPEGNWGTYQEPVPDSPFFYPIFSIDVETGGRVLANCSRANSAYSFGFVTVDLGTNTWTNYNSETNPCLTSSTFNHVISDGSGNFLCNPYDVFDNSKLLSFDPVNNTCEEIDLNYMDAPNINPFITNFGVRTKENGRLEIGVADLDQVIMFGYDPDNENNPFSTNMMLDLGDDICFEVFGQGDRFIGDLETGLAFINSLNEIDVVPFEIDGFGSIKTRIPKNTSDDTVIAPISYGNILNEGKVYFSRCDVITANCNDWTEITIENWDNSRPLLYSSIKGLDGTRSSSFLSRKQNEDPNEIAIEQLRVTPSDQAEFRYTAAFLSDLLSNNEISGNIKDMASVLFYREFPSNLRNQEANFGSVVYGDLSMAAISPAGSSSDPPVSEEFEIDLNLDSEPDQILRINNSIYESGEGTLVLTYAIVNTVEGLDIVNLVFTIDSEDYSIGLNYESIGSSVLSSPPSDLVVYSSELVQTDEDSAALILYTNYGFIFKSGLALNSLSLSINDYNSLNSNILYPNPAEDLIKITNLEVSKVAIFDLNGQLLLTSNQPSISISNLPEGLYFVKITEAITGNSITKKLIKSN